MATSCAPSARSSRPSGDGAGLLDVVGRRGAGPQGGHPRPPAARRARSSSAGWPPRPTSSAKTSGPGAMEAWGIGPDDCDPRLVWARISVFGQDGPYSGRTGLDRMGIAYGGLLHLTGYPDRPPVRPGVSISDYLTGTFAASAVDAALYRRDGPGGHRAGRGGRRLRCTAPSCASSNGRSPPRTAWASPASGRATGWPLRPARQLPHRGRHLRLHRGRLQRQLPPAVRGHGHGPELADDPQWSTLAKRAARSDEINDLVASWTSHAHGGRGRGGVHRPRGPGGHRLRGHRHPGRSPLRRPGRPGGGRRPGGRTPPPTGTLPPAGRAHAGRAPRPRPSSASTTTRSGATWWASTTDELDGVPGRRRHLTPSPSGATSPCSPRSPWSSRPWWPPSDWCRPTTVWTGRVGNSAVTARADRHGPRGGGGGHGPAARRPGAGRTRRRWWSASAAGSIPASRWAPCSTPSGSWTTPAVPSTGTRPPPGWTGPGTLVTTAEVHFDDELSRRLLADGALGVDMESAAVARVCEQRGRSVVHPPRHQRPVGGRPPRPPGGGPDGDGRLDRPRRARPAAGRRARPRPPARATGRRHRPGRPTGGRGRALRGCRATRRIPGAGGRVAPDAVDPGRAAPASPESAKRGDRFSEGGHALGHLGRARGQRLDVALAVQGQRQGGLEAWR